MEDQVYSGLFDITEKSKGFIPEKATLEEWEAIIDSVEGYTGAFLAETVKRAMLAMLDRDIPKVTPQDVITAANSLREQFDVYERAGEPEHKDSLEEAMMDAFKKAFEPAFEDGIVRVQMDTEEGTFAVMEK